MSTIDFTTADTRTERSACQTMMTAARIAWSDDRLDALVESTVADIRHIVGSKRASFVWSGATDSLVLALLAGFAGIEQCVLTITNLEYPAYLRWVTEHMPERVAIVDTGQDLAWLRCYPRMLFPQQAYGPHWRRLVAHRGEERHYHDKNLGMLLVPERRGYGPSRELTVRNRDGVLRYTPLVDWSDEAMLALIERESLPLPPCYQWPRGFEVGPGPWPARQHTTSIAHGFEEVWSIDADVIRQAAPELPQAARWLRATGRC